MRSNPSSEHIFSRKKLLLRNAPARQAHPHSVTETSIQFSGGMPALDSQYTVLVINSSHSIAKEITIELTLQIPGCSIMYAPTIELARFLLNRRKIDLVVSCPLLPDGSISRLKETLSRMQQPPDLVVVGQLNAKSADIMSDTRYEFAALRRLGAPVSKEIDRASAAQPAEMQRTIRELGADLRNDLNNPLQEIVAMVFVAQAGGSPGSAVTSQALQAIDKAARNMATVVNTLEDKIRTAVQPGNEGR